MISKEKKKIKKLNSNELASLFGQVQKKKKTLIWIGKVSLESPLSGASFYTFGILLLIKDTGRLEH